MIFGVTIKKFQRLLNQGEKAKASKRTLRLIQKASNKKINTKDLLTMSMSDFIDLERFLLELNYYNFCRIFVKDRFIFAHNLTYIMLDYAKQKENIQELHRWVFNPPQYGEPEKETIGSDLRKDFVLEFGNNVVLTDLICQKQSVNHAEVEKWKVEKFMFWADYYSGQKILENLK